VHRLAVTTAFCVGKRPVTGTACGATLPGWMRSSTIASTTSGTKAPTEPTTLTRSSRQARVRHPITTATRPTAAMRIDPRSVPIVVVAMSTTLSVRRSANHAAMLSSTTDSPLCRMTMFITEARPSPTRKSSPTPAVRLSSSAHPGPMRIESRKNSTPYRCRSHRAGGSANARPSSARTGSGLRPNQRPTTTITTIVSSSTSTAPVALPRYRETVSYDVPAR
jgi:hypothetical protein